MYLSITIINVISGSIIINSSNSQKKKKIINKLQDCYSYSYSTG